VKPLNELTPEEWREILFPRRTPAEKLRVEEKGKQDAPTPKSPYFTRDFARSCQHILASVYDRPVTSQAGFTRRSTNFLL